MKKILLVLLAVIINYLTYSQTWIRVYEDSVNSIYAFRILEQYDHGYLFSGKEYRVGYFTKENQNEFLQFHIKE